MTRPSNLIYSVTETPPSVVCLLSAFQHIAILAPTLAYPILGMRAAGFSEQAIVPSVSLALVAMGVGTALQTSAHRYVGS